jgi:phosphatidylserine/phosphatidylglycerophosphate/cardiolipin synthase-like enzyme
MKLLEEIRNRWREFEDTGHFSSTDIRLYVFGFREKLKEELSNAKHEIYILHYNISGAATHTKDIWDIVEKKVLEGVKVLVITNRRFTTASSGLRNQESVDFLRKKNIPVYVYTGNKIFHWKVVLIDREKIFIGSHNLSENSLSHNIDASILITSKELYQDLLTYILEFIEEIKDKQ